MNESRSDDRFFKKDRSKKFVFKKKLELIEGGNLASIWKCFDQHYIGESIEMFYLVLQFPLIPQWNAEQDISRSMPSSDLRLVPTFFQDEFFDSVNNKMTERTA